MPADPLRQLQAIMQDCAGYGPFETSFYNKVTKIRGLFANIQHPNPKNKASAPYCAIVLPATDAMIDNTVDTISAAIHSCAVTLGLKA